ncbi:MAG: hypothetical protein LBT40_16095 [Deltaproteobacteria bacterium]|nr:hypothetical protein [Deltaproteobacteria bacterium]
MTHKEENSKEDQDRFSAALEWYFADKPYGSKTELSVLLGKSKGFVSSVTSKNIVSPESRRLISAGLGIPLETMLKAGQVILDGGDPGPKMPDFPRTDWHGNPLKPGGLATTKMWTPKSGPPLPKGAENYIAAALDTKIFKVPMTYVMRLVPDESGNLVFPTDASSSDSPISLSQAMFPGIDPKNIHAVRMMETCMEPLLHKHDILIVDTSRKKGYDILQKVLYMVESEHAGVKIAVPRFVSLGKDEYHTLIYALNSRRWWPIRVDLRELEVMGTVIMSIWPFQNMSKPIFRT